MPTNQPVNSNSEFHNYRDIYTKEFNTVDVSDTIGTWVDAFNKNALAASDHTWYLGEMLFNGMLYTGRETIGGVTISSLTNLNIASQSPESIELDNFYLYFKDINKILLLDHVTFDISDYNDGHPHFFYINSDLGFRVSQDFDQHDNEIQLFRFLISTGGVFQQCYVTAQRFGSNVYDTADEYFQVQGCQPLPAPTELTLKLDNGSLKRSGIHFDYHQVPDVFKVIDNDIPFPLRYVTVENKVDYTAETRTTVNPDQYLNYTTGVLSSVPTDKFSTQRILLDLYQGCLIIQYGNGVYNTMQEALSSLSNVDYPFPYNSLMYIPLGLMFIKEGCDDLTDPEQCVLVQHTNLTVKSTDSAFFAEDSYARGKIDFLNNEITVLQQAIVDLQNSLQSHTTNYSNPHQVTKTQVGLGNVDNYSYTTIRSKIQTDLTDIWIKKNVNDTTSGHLQIGGGVTVPSNAVVNNQASYIMINNQRLYLGVLPSDAPDGSWGIQV